MSYITMLPNYFYNGLTPLNQCFAQMPLNHNVPSNKNILSTLASALKISLDNYSLKTLQISTIPIKTTVDPVKSTCSQKINNNLLETQRVHLQKTDLNNLTKNLSNISESCQLTKTQGKEGNQEPQLQTDDQFHFQEKEKSERKAPTKKVKKNKEDPCSDFIIVVPKINLIQTAQLPAYGEEELSRKRQDLLMRKVVDWSAFIKVKKEKREIRMLQQRSN